MSDSRTADEAAIQAVLVDSYKAWEAGDADGMVASYTADATAIMRGAAQGQLDLEQAAQPPLRRPGRRHRRQRIRHPAGRGDRGSGRA